MTQTTEFLSALSAAATLAQSGALQVKDGEVCVVLPLKELMKVAACASTPEPTPKPALDALTATQREVKRHSTPKQTEKSHDRGLSVPAPTHTKQRPQTRRYYRAGVVPTLRRNTNLRAYAKRHGWEHRQYQFMAMAMKAKEMGQPLTEALAREIANKAQEPYTNHGSFSSVKGWAEKHNLVKVVELDPEHIESPGA